MSQHRKPRLATLQHAFDHDGDTTQRDTAFAMALLWVIPVVAFLLALAQV